VRARRGKGSTYAVDDGERLLLIDPTTLPAPILDLAADRETVIVLTNPWHERHARNLSESLGAPVFAPPPDDEGTGMRPPYDVARWSLILQQARPHVRIRPQPSGGGSKRECLGTPPYG
jgi:hypothetical protein